MDSAFSCNTGHQEGGYPVHGVPLAPPPVCYAMHRRGGGLGGQSALPDIFTGKVLMTFGENRAN